MTDEIEQAAQAESARRAEKSAAAFRTISEVAEELDVPQHVLRFWETKFSQVRPMKRGGGRRYYRPEDVELLRKIRTLLYEDGYTIRGVQKLLRQSGVRGLISGAEAAQPEAKPPVATPAPAPTASPPSGGRRQALSEVLEELYAIRSLINRNAR